MPIPRTHISPILDISRLYRYVTLERQDMSPSRHCEPRERQIPRTGSSRDFHTKFGDTLKRQAHRDEAIDRVAYELQKVGLRVVVHHVAPRSHLRCQDFDNLARERRLPTIGPA